MEMVSKRMDLWSGGLETIKTSHHKINLNGRRCLVSQELYHAVLLSEEVVFEHIDKHLQSDLV